MNRPFHSLQLKLWNCKQLPVFFLFYSRAVDPTMLTAINKIASRQAKPTSLIKKEVERFLQYANKWPDATMRIRASNMKLVCHSDGSYLSESVASYSWAIVQITRHPMLSSKLWSRQLLQLSTQQHSSLVKLPLASSIH